MLPLWAFAAAVLQTGAAPGLCSLTAPAACRDTNELAGSPGLREAIAAFLGGRRADHLYKGHDVADQAVDVLGGPPDSPARIGPYWRFTACRAHSCGEKGALVLLPTGGIVAIGILHGRCSLPQPGPDCYAHDTLTLYVRHAGPDVIRDLKAWGAEQVRSDRSVGLRVPTLDAVEVVPV